MNNAELRTCTALTLWIIHLRYENNDTSHAQLRRVVTVIRPVTKGFVGSGAVGSPWSYCWNGDKETDWNLKQLRVSVVDEWRRCSWYLFVRSENIHSASFLSADIRAATVTLNKWAAESWCRSIKNTLHRLWMNSVISCLLFALPWPLFIQESRLNASLSCRLSYSTQQHCRYFQSSCVPIGIFTVCTQVPFSSVITSSARPRERPAIVCLGESDSAERHSSASLAASPVLFLPPIVLNGLKHSHLKLCALQLSNSTHQMNWPGCSPRNLAAKEPSVCFFFFLKDNLNYIRSERSSCSAPLHLSCTCHTALHLQKNKAAEADSWGKQPAVTFSSTRFSASPHKTQLDLLF